MASLSFLQFYVFFCLAKNGDILRLPQDMLGKSNFVKVSDF